MFFIIAYVSSEFEELTRVLTIVRQPTGGCRLAVSADQSVGAAFIPKSCEPYHASNVTVVSGKSFVGEDRGKTRIAKSCY
jgi:hypothetical protein